MSIRLFAWFNFQSFLLHFWTYQCTYVYVRQFFSKLVRFEGASADLPSVFDAKYLGVHHIVPRFEDNSVYLKWNRVRCNGALWSESKSRVVYYGTFPLTHILFYRRRALRSTWSSICSIKCIRMQQRRCRSAKDVTLSVFFHRENDENSHRCTFRECPIASWRSVSCRVKLDDAAE